MITWDQAAQVAIVIEAGVVALSLLLILIQLRQQTKLSKITNAQSIVEVSSPFFLQLMQDRNLATLWMTGGQMYEHLDEVDKYRYRSLLSWWLTIHETAYYEWQQGFLDLHVYAGWRRDLSTFLSEQNVRQYWDEFRDFFPADYRQHIEALMQQDTQVRKETD